LGKSVHFRDCRGIRTNRRERKRAGTLCRELRPMAQPRATEDSVEVEL
jgi:transposase InsO family protein